MQDYEFYVEYDGNKTVSQNYAVPTDTNVERSIEKAAKKFARRKKMKYIDHDVLRNDSNGYRVFFETKKQEFVFYVRAK